MTSPFKFIHITDLHLKPPGEKLWGLNPQERFDHCLKDIESWHDDAEFCVISGDLADAGEPGAYDWLRDRLAAFPLPCHLMIGNHDERETFKAHFPDTPVDPDGFVQHAFDTSAGRFLLLDTFKGGTSSGEYCNKRQSWLRTQLDTAGDAPVWIFMHHPPFDISIPYMDRIKLEDHQAFAGLTAGNANIRHIFYGHVHRPGYVNWQGIPCTSLPSINHQIPLSPDSIAGIPYSDEPPMYAVVLINENQVTIHFDAFDHRQPADMPPRKPR